MKILLAIFSAIAVLAAQEPGAQKEEAAPESPQPVPESKWQVTTDFGFRWLGDTGGDFRTYRSLVNLGQGPKLFGTEGIWQDPDSKLLNRFTVSARNWGGDPFTTLHATAERTSLWRVTADYRNLLYYNFLPSFANPLLGQGSLLNQRAFDQRRRISSVDLDLFPGRRIIPYLAYERAAMSGLGTTPFYSEANEFAVANSLRNETNLYRGGVRFEYGRWHVTLEQGGLTFKDDQNVFTSDRNLGNRLTPVLGRQLFLAGLDQAYGVRGNSLNSKGLLTASPFPWLNLFGSFLYSRAKSETHYTHDADGLFLLAVTRFYTTGENALDALSKMPHTSATAGAEIEAGKFRLSYTWMTDRLHNAASALLAETFVFSPANTERIVSTTLDRLVVNHNRQEINGYYDLFKRVTLRGGYRYVWGDSTAAAARLNPFTEYERGELRQHVGIGGVYVRPGRGATWNLEYEGANADRVYFRTSLADYHKLRLRGRQQIRDDLRLGFQYALLDNRNPFAAESAMRPTMMWKSRSDAASASVHWLPKGGRFGALLGEYAYTRMRSDIQYLVPQTLQLGDSFYREYGHTVTALVEVAMQGTGIPNAGLPRFTFGGSMHQGTGSRPSRFYQPVAGFRLPVTPRVEWYADWRWYGFGQPTYLYETFRTHTVVAGLRVGM